MEKKQYYKKLIRLLVPFACGKGGLRGFLFLKKCSQVQLSKLTVCHKIIVENLFSYYLNLEIHSIFFGMTHEILTICLRISNINILILYELKIKVS